MPKSEERRSNIVSSSSSSPRFFSWKSRNSSTKRNNNHHPQHYQQQQPQPPISMSSPSSPLMMEKEHISSCSSPQLVRLNTPKPMNIDEHRSLITPKTNQIRKIDENSNQSDMDEHIQIALYAQQLASISEKQNQNPSGVQPPIRFPSVPMNLQMNNQYYPRMTTTTATTPTPSAMVPMSSIRSMHMDHQSAEKRLIINKLEAKNR